MKLIVQIPCYNEEESLPATLAAIPRSVAGFDSVEVLVIDDGSTDGTARVAREQGADWVVRHRRNRGLAAAFRTGLEQALALGADVIVNTDADNQYDAADLPRLVEPILAGQADMVVGDRRPGELRHFSPLKRWLQRLGSAVVGRAAGVEVGDAVSGFRALTRAAALRLNVVSDFSYTIETLIQAGRGRLAVVSVPVGSRPTRRPSRLISSLPRFLERSAGTVLRVYTMYHPLRVFLGLGTILALAGTAPILRFLWYWSQGEGQGKVQSLVLGGTLLVLGFVTALAGVLADLISFNRKLTEELVLRVRRLECRAGGAAAEAQANSAAGNNALESELLEAPARSAARFDRA